MISISIRTNVAELVKQYARRADQARDAARRGAQKARPRTDAILNQEAEAAFKVRDPRMRRAWRLWVPSSGEIKLVIMNLMRGFGLHVTGGVVSPARRSKLLIPINTRFGSRIGTKKFANMIVRLRYDKMLLIKGNVVYVRVPMNTSRRGGVGIGTRVQKSFRTRLQGTLKRPSGFDIKLNAEGLTPIAVLRPSIALRKRFDMDRIARDRIIPVVLESIRSEFESLR
jgi:hypothetical protein